MQTGEVEANPVTLNERFKLPYISKLVERKLAGLENGTLDNADTMSHECEYERLHALLETARNTSHLPDELSCKSVLNDLLLRIRGIS